MNRESAWLEKARSTIASSTFSPTSSPYSTRNVQNDEIAVTTEPVVDPVASLYGSALVTHEPPEVHSSGLVDSIVEKPSAAGGSLKHDSSDSSDTESFEDLGDMGDHALAAGLDPSAEPEDSGFLLV